MKTASSLLIYFLLACAVIFIVSVIVGCGNQGDGMSRQEVVGIVQLDKEYRN